MPSDASFGIGRTARRIVVFPFRYPAIWSWPAAAWLMLQIDRHPMEPQYALRGYYLPALGLVLLGCLPSVFVGRPRSRTVEPPFLPRWLLIVLTVAVLVAATALRLWRIGEWPPDGMGLEEFQLAGRAPVGDWMHNFLDLYSQPGEHTLTVYAVSLSFSYLGGGFVEMRLPFMLVTIAAPFLFYVVCRRLVSWEVSLFALALFAVSWWQIAAGRIADEIFFPMWVELVILWALIQFDDTGRSWAAFVVALLSGLLIYEYTSYHLVIVVVAGYLVARAAVFAAQSLYARGPSRPERRRWVAALRTYGPGAVAMLLVWVIVAHFQLVADIRNGMGSWFSGGVGGHANDPDGLLAQLGSPSHLAEFVLRKLALPVQAAYLPGHGEFCRYIGIGGDAAFDRATAIGMGVGAVLVALTFWRPYHALVLVWAGIVIAGAALLPANPNLHRYYTGLPFYYLLIALGAEVLWRGLRQRWARYAMLGVFAGMIAYAAYWNVDQLFWRLLPNQQLHDNWIWPRTEIARWIRTHGPDGWFCVLADGDMSVYGADPLQAEWKWMLYGWDVRVAGPAADCIPAPDDEKRARYYIFALPDSPPELEARLRQHYPDAREQELITAPKNEFKARTFFVPPRTGG